MIQVIRSSELKPHRDISCLPLQCRKSIFHSFVPKICCWSMSVSHHVSLSSIQWRSSNRQGRPPVARPCTQALPRQANRRQFHSTILHTNRGQFLAFMAPECRISKANFHQKFGSDTSGPPLMEWLSQLAPPPTRLLLP